MRWPLLLLSLLLLVAAMQVTEANASSQYKYIGCFADGKKRDLPTFKARSGRMTIRMCGDMCRRGKFLYFGVQFGGYCYCGNVYGRYKPIPQNQCNIKCSGNRRLVCGGRWRNSVFTTGLKVKVQRRQPNLYKYRYIGCFVDGKKRDLPVFKLRRRDMTSDMCGDACRRSGFAYSGVQAGKLCFCGNSYGRYKRIGRCNWKCSSDRADLCGGGWSNSLFATGLKANKKSKKYRYIGCFADKERNYLHVNKGSSQKMTSGMCGDICSKGKFAYFGVHRGSYCFCGNSYGIPYMSLPASRCAYRCRGNRKETTCGGRNTNSVFAI